MALNPLKELLKRLIPDCNIKNKFDELTSAVVGENGQSYANG